MIAGLFLSSLISAAIGASQATNMTYYTLNFEMEKLLPTRIADVVTSILWPDFLQATKVLVNIPTNIRCSFEAKKARAVAFTFKDGTCSLLSSGGSTSAQVFFYRFPSEDSLEEVAKGKNTTASTPDGAYCPPGKAVDGFLAEYGYYSGLLVKPWWQVDLGEVRLIYQIQIYPRQILYTRFHDVEVRVGTTLISNGIFSAYSFLCSYTKVYELAEGYLLCSRYNGVIGRYVSIQITAAAAEYLQLMEVKVFVLKKTASP